MKACEMVFSSLQGTWGIVILDTKNPKQLVLARNGSPILIGNFWIYNWIGISENAFYVSSEAIAFQKYTNQYVSLQEGELVKLDLDNPLGLQDRIQTFKTK